MTARTATKYATLAANVVTTVDLTGADANLIDPRGLVIAVTGTRQPGTSGPMARPHRRRRRQPRRPRRPVARTEARSLGSAERPS